MTGCGTFLSKPFFPKRTGAEGVVLDQYNQPVPNAPLEASGLARSWSWTVFYTGFYESKFSADEQGKWCFYRRDADRMSIDAKDIPGYKRCEGSSIYPIIPAGRIYYGQYITNVVLRLRKLDPPPAGDKK